MYLPLLDQLSLKKMLGWVEKIAPESTLVWGETNVAQVWTHNNVGFDIANSEIPVSYNFLIRFMLKMMVKSTVVGNKPYEKNDRAGPSFVIAGDRDFAKGKAALVSSFKAFHSAGTGAYEGQESKVFGKLSAQEWSNTYWKHMDHHLTQFGV